MAHEADFDTIHRAAEAMRQQHGPQHPRHKMWRAMSDLLDGLATDGGTSWDFRQDEALDVAKAYLAAEPAEPERPTAHPDTMIGRGRATKRDNRWAETSRAIAEAVQAAKPADADTGIVVGAGLRHLARLHLGEES